MSWGRWVSQCQWDAACRAFLQRDPAFGMATARLAEGGTEGYEPGWNRWVPRSKSQPTLYVFIGDSNGLTTLAPPPPGTPVKDVERQPADLHRSPLWQALLTSANNLIGHGGGPPKRVYRARHFIRQSATADDDAAWAADASRRGAEMIRDTWRRSDAGPAAINAFWEPVLLAVHSFMDFRANGEVASDVVASLLFTLCSIPRVPHGPGGHTAPPFVDAVEHLIGVVDALKARRDQLNTPSYMQATYLAALYAAAAMKLISLARHAIADAYAAEAFGDWNDAAHTKLAKLHTNIDEVSAHDIAPGFVLPALFTPLHLLRRLDGMAAGSDLTAAQWADYFRLDPALRKMVDSGTPWQDATPGDAAERHRALSDARQALDVEASLDKDFSPISRQTKRDLLEAVMAKRVR